MAGVNVSGQRADGCGWCPGAGVIPPSNNIMHATGSAARDIDESPGKQH